jgi:hypothetical protein
MHDHLEANAFEGVFVTPVAYITVETLLQQADFIKKKDLEYVTPLAKKMRLPIGRVLVSTGYIRAHILNIALAAQSLVNGKAITLIVAVRALKEADTRNIGLDEVLLEYGLSAKLLDYTNKLGQLLVDSEFVTERQRSDALQMALSSNLPMARILVLQRVITNIQAYAALSAQILLRRGEVSREQAITALKMTKLTNCPLELALKKGGFVDSQSFGKVMLGELLMISNQLSEMSFLTSLEKSLINSVPLGKVLVESGCISQDTLERALYAQKQVSEGRMTQMFAADFVKFDHNATVQAVNNANNITNLNARSNEQKSTPRNLTHAQIAAAQLISSIGAANLAQVV